MKEVEQCYRVLGLEPGASLEEVNQAYKDLAFIWHPDRIPKDNPRLLEKAQETLKQINHARDFLRSASPTRSVRSGDRSYQDYPPHRDYPRSDYYYYSPHAESYYETYSTYRPEPNHTSSSGRTPKNDLSGANLSGSDLKEKDLSGRNLSGADLTEADLSDTFLHKTNLQGANLFRANLFRANLLQANLSQTNLREAKLIGADLSGADLSGADLRGAQLGTKTRLLVKLTGANLTGAIGLDAWR
jgi:curved DNA-binding protein CbpA